MPSAKTPERVSGTILDTLVTGDWPQVNQPLHHDLSRTDSHALSPLASFPRLTPGKEPKGIAGVTDRLGKARVREHFFSFDAVERPL